MSGINGKVSYRWGNWMPSGRGGDEPISTEVYAVKPMMYDELESLDIENDTFKKAIIAKTTSDENGDFFLDLDPGEYSILVHDYGIKDDADWGRGFHPKVFGSSGYMSYVELNKNETRKLDILIDHAVY